MEAKITELRGEEEIAKVETLAIDGIEATKVEGLTDAFAALHTLAINTGLESLEGFPKLPALTRLDLSHNSLAGGLNVLASGCAALTHLDLTANKIKDLDALEPLKTLDKLVSLKLSENPVEEDADLRTKVFKIIPSLQLLDGADVDNEEDIDEEEEEDGEEEEDLDDEEDEEGGPGLSAIYNDNLSDDGEDFDEEGEGEEDDDDIEDEEEVEGEPASKKAKTDGE